MVPKNSSQSGASPLDLYRDMLVARRIEESMLKLLRQGKISKWFSGIGQEAIAVGATHALEPTDTILPTHRNLGVFTSRGISLYRLFCQLLGRNGGFTHGRDRTFHFAVPDLHIIGMISHLASMLPVACGTALASSLRNESRVSLVFCGDGATSEGDFHEALNLAAVWKLPVIFVVENNGWAISTPTTAQYACDRLADRAIGYGMAGSQIDGNDAVAVYDAVSQAATRARAGEGPALLEALTYRLRGHEEASGVDYVPESELSAAWEQDPLMRLEHVLRKTDLLTDVLSDELEQEVQATISGPLADALADVAPSSTSETELAAVYAPRVTPPATLPTTAQKHPQKRYLDAITDALTIAMEADESVILCGQDIAEHGGVFKATAGLADRFGTKRVRNTPVTESAIVGAGLGLALEGFKPVIEMQFADFVSCAFNQIVNNLAKTHYRWGGAVNVTLRLPSGGGLGGGPFHSQSPEAWFCHVPGLKVVSPSTPVDAKGLLLAAINEPNPVIFLEHKGLYRSVTGDVPEGLYEVPIGKAQVRKTGSDATIVTWGVGVGWALELASRWAGDNIDLEVIDLRSLVPWDRELVLYSVAKTGRVLVLHEAPTTAGFGAEVAAQIAQEAFWDLDAPVMRAASLDTPIPFDAQLERDVYWPVNDLDDTLFTLLR